MAYQGKKRGAQIVKTPAPTVEAKLGGTSYGQAQDVFTPSSIAPGSKVQSVMAQNLREGQADSEDVLSQVEKFGAAGKDDNRQTRAVSTKGYSPSHGMKSPNLEAGKYDTLPDKLGASAKPVVRNPS